jgi:hypothetical protein
MLRNARKGQIIPEDSTEIITTVCYKNADIDPTINMLSKSIEDTLCKLINPYIIEIYVGATEQEPYTKRCKQHLKEDKFKNNDWHTLCLEKYKVRAI